jgi:hypothetical protein
MEVKTLHDINIEMNIREPVYGTITRTQLRKLSAGELVQVLREIGNIIDFRYGKPHHYIRPQAIQQSLDLSPEEKHG